jgi:hypothetical protein
MDRPLDPHLKLLVEVDRVEPLGGVVGVPDGPARPFSGWIGLAGAITAHLGSPAAPSVAGDSTDL